MKEFFSYPVVQKINGQLVTIEIIKHGPVAFCVTTTKAALHPENETRMLSLEIDDSEEQTKRVLKKLAQTTGKNIKARRQHPLQLAGLSAPAAHRWRGKRWLEGRRAVR